MQPGVLKRLKFPFQWEPHENRYRHESVSAGVELLTEAGHEAVHWSNEVNPL